MSDARDLTDLLGDTRARIVTELRTGAATAAGLADELQITPTAVRRHLTALDRDGLAQSEAVRDGSMGRPVEQWHLTSRGRRLFIDKSAAFADEVLVHMEATYGREAVLEFLQARSVAQGKKYADQISDAQTPHERAAALADALNEEGFAARIEDTPDGRTLTLVQSHCAIEDVAAAHPEVCAHETAMFTQLLGAKISRCDTIADGSPACVCRIEVSDE